VRFISATNVPLQRAAEEGSFRSDLFHRLNGVTIELPPLRDREGDIELLARHLVATLGKRLGKQDLDISRGALDRIQEYTWPGNVRELQRVLSAAVVLADSEVSVDDLPEYMRDVPSTRSATEASDLPINLREIKEWAGREAQKRVIIELQKSTNMSRQELARLLGVDPKTLRSRLKEMTAGLPRAR
jgi:DNA-binding NtrC family response regulator